MILAIGYSDTVTLGAIIVAVLVIAVAGLPVRLIQTLRTEREEWKEQAIEEKERIRTLEVEVAEWKARTDLTQHQSKMQEFNETLAAEVAAQMATIVKEAEVRIVELVSHQTEVLNEQTAVLEKIANKLEGGLT